MKYINTFKTHASYEEKLNGGGVGISLPNVSYCEDVKDVHYNPYNTVEFYVGEITTPQTVKIYTDKTTSIPIQISEGNKWYTYVLPKDKGLCMIEGDSVKKVVVKADISYEPISSPPFYYNTIIPRSTIKASFKGSNTSNLTDMKWMFSGCTDITSLDVSSFDTSKVTNMASMFSNCSGLKSLDVSSFDTINVTDMQSMFKGCSGLTSLDLSNLNTSKVTDMSGMFNGCSGLTSLDLRNFKTSKVIYMASMFNGCSGLKSLDLSKFNTSNVINMNSMFKGCSGLTSLDLSGWNMSNVTYTTKMFDGCSALNKITIKGCSEATRTKIQNQLTKDGITGVEIIQ